MWGATGPAPGGGALGGGSGGNGKGAAHNKTLEKRVGLSLPIAGSLREKPRGIGACFRNLHEGKQGKGIANTRPAKKYTNQRRYQKLGIANKDE